MIGFILVGTFFLLSSLFLLCFEYPSAFLDILYILHFSYSLKCVHCLTKCRRLPDCRPVYEPKYEGEVLCQPSFEFPMLKRRVPGGHLFLTWSFSWPLSFRLDSFCIQGLDLYLNTTAIHISSHNLLTTCVLHLFLSRS